MALQALANYQHKPEVKAATEKALAVLSKIQDSNGGYTGSLSGGSPALESAAQVLIALCELGIPFDDARFMASISADEIIELLGLDTKNDLPAGVMAMSQK